MKMKIERGTTKFEIGNFMILMKYYFAKGKRRYFISGDTSQTDVMVYIQMKREKGTINTEIGNIMILMKYYIANRRRRHFIS